VFASEEEFALALPDEFYAFLSEVTPETIEEIILADAAATPSEDTTEAESKDPGTEIGGGIEVPPTTSNYRAGDSQQLCSNCSHFQAHPQGDDGFCDLWGTSADGNYVCDSYASAAEPAQSAAGAGGETPPATPQPGANMSELTQDERTFLSEIFLAGGTVTTEDGKIWKTVLREGRWKYSPSPDGSGKPMDKPIIITKDGDTKVTKDAIHVSMEELVANFNDGAVEHVTIPASHADHVLENTGYARAMRMTQEDGKWVVQAHTDFTEPDVAARARNGSIANTSAGILFDYLKKETGKKYRAVIAHVALTNKPWLNGMKPFGVEASELPVYAMGFSEDESRDLGGGDSKMSELLTELGLSEDEVRAQVAENKRLKANERTRNVEETCTRWEGEKKSPAIVAKAREFMLGEIAEDGGALLLSENGQPKTMPFADAIAALVEASPSIALSEATPPGVAEEGASADGKPPVTEETDMTKLSEEVKREAAYLFFTEGVSSEEAIKKAKAKLEPEAAKAA
jgi:phage I-like protein